MNHFFKCLAVVDQLISRLTRGICVVVLGAIVIMFLLNVFVRFVPVYNFTQTDDWIQLCLIWMIFLGAQELVRTRNHFVVEVVTERLEGMTGKICRILVCLIEMVTYALICYYGWVWVMRAHAYMQSIPWMQVKVVYAVIPISAFFMTCYSIRDLVAAIQFNGYHTPSVSED